MSFDNSVTARRLKRLLVQGVERRHWFRLSREFPDFDLLAAQSETVLGRVGGLNAETARRLKEGAPDEEVEAELLAMEQYGVRLLTRFDDGFPFLLGQMSVPPMALYVAGDLAPDDELAVGVVGPRTPSTYGREMARRIATDLARAGITVVSGFAVGIDAAAHRSALESGGRTLGVLGCGLSVNYPAGHSDLRQPIVSGAGALLSEYPMTAAPLAGHFPPRNTLIAGLSLAVIVVEAAERSGALVTARAALEENRHVYAVPGDVTRAKSRGFNGLLRAGAIPLTSVNDLLEDLEAVLSGIARRLEEEGKLNRPTALEPVYPEEQGPSREPSRGKAPTGPGPIDEADEPAGSEGPGGPGELDNPGGKIGHAGADGAARSVGSFGSVRSAGSAPSASVAPSSPSRAGASRRRRPDGPDACRLLDHIAQESMIDLDTLMAELVPDPFSVGRLSSLLLQLELSGFIRQLPGKQYVAV